MQSSASNRQVADDDAAFALPDFLDLAGNPIDAPFACSSSTSDGGVAVHEDRIEVLRGQSSHVLPRETITGWSSSVDDAGASVTIAQARTSVSARVALPYIAAVNNALERALGPSDEDESLA